MPIIEILTFANVLPFNKTCNSFVISARFIE